MKPGLPGAGWRGCADRTAVAGGELVGKSGVTSVGEFAHSVFSRAIAQEAMELSCRFGKQKAQGPPPFVADVEGKSTEHDPARASTPEEFVWLLRAFWKWPAGTRYVTWQPGPVTLPTHDGEQPAGRGVSDAARLGRPVRRGAGPLRFWNRHSRQLRIRIRPGGAPTRAL
jgi:hypothetical protein